MYSFTQKIVLNNADQRTQIVKTKPIPNPNANHIPNININPDPKSQTLTTCRYVT